MHRAILEGDATTGISIMRMEAGLDTGPVAVVRETPVAPCTTESGANTLPEKGNLAENAAEAALAGLFSRDELGKL